MFLRLPFSPRPFGCRDYWENHQAANQIVLNLTSMTYMVALGLGVTAMIRVGNEKGRSDFITLRRVAISIFLLIMLLSSFFALFFIATHDFLPWLYLNGNSPEISNDVFEVVEIASNLIVIAAFFKLPMEFRLLFWEL